MDFKLKVPFESREAYSKHIRFTFPGKYGVIVQPFKPEEFNILSKFKFVVDGNLDLRYFVIKAFRESLKPYGGLFFISLNRDNKSVILNTKATISMLHEKYADEDGLLYIYYLKENTFG